jgi:hypothetical protein
MNRPTTDRLFRFAATALIPLCLIPLLSNSSISRASTAPSPTSPPTAKRMAGLPPLMLWAWERPEDLRFLGSNHVGVAYLAATILLGPNGATFRPRLQPLRVSPDTKLMAVIRIETSPGARLDSTQAAAIAAQIARTASLAQVAAVQIDFDAAESQHSFYAELLRDLRQRLAPSMPISITALASWCIGDRWLTGLPIDEAVPMLFRMGVGEREVSNWLALGRDFRSAECRGSLGISTDELRPAPLSAGRRVYAFSPAPWSEHSLATLHSELQSWR